MREVRPLQEELIIPYAHLTMVRGQKEIVRELLSSLVVVKLNGGLVIYWRKFSQKIFFRGLQWAVKDQSMFLEGIDSGGQITRD